ncbi:Uncharacterised protein [Cellulomonas fimi]|nr:Uncharacterised protein [Cellulomonas fimi]
MRCPTVCPVSLLDAAYELWLDKTWGRRAVVVFTVQPDRLRRMDVATGPCVPQSGLKRPLQGVLAQDLGESPAQSAALFTALTGHAPEGALVVLEEAGSGRLSVCSETFLNAMADACEEHLALADADEAAGRKDLPTFARAYDELAVAWRQAVRWPRHVAPLSQRLGRLGSARHARLKEQPLYMWHGPSVPMFAIATGRMPDR